MEVPNQYQQLREIFPRETHCLYLEALWRMACLNLSDFVVVTVQLQSCVRLFMTLWTAACHASLSLTISKHLPKFMSIESVMPSNHLILSQPVLLPSVFPRIKSFPLSELFTSGGQRMGASASASVLPKGIQGQIYSTVNMLRGILLL